MKLRCTMSTISIFKPGTIYKGIQIGRRFYALADSPVERRYFLYQMFGEYCFYKFNTLIATFEEVM